MKQYKYSFILGLLAGLVFVSVFFIFMGKVVNAYSYENNTAKNFNNTQWLKGEERIEMLTDLQIHHLRKGMTKKQVIKLLGKPDRSGHFEKTYSNSSKVVSYDLGYKFLDPCTFDLEFSDKDVLENYSENDS